MRGEKCLVAVFSDEYSACHALELLRSQGMECRLYSPVAPGRLLPSRLSAVFAYVLAAGLLGGLAGHFVFSSWIALPNPQSAQFFWGRFVFLWPLCIGAVVLGGIVSLLALFYFCGLPSVLRAVGYDGRFSQWQFGLAVGCEKGQIVELSQRLSQAGAQEVSVREGF